VFAAFAAFLVYKAPLWFLQEQKIARMQRFEEQLPEAVNVMVASVRAGNSLITAIQEVADKIPGPVAREFKTIVREHLSAGIGLEEALSRARDRLPVESFAMISSALIINSSQGGDLLKILERMASAIRELDRLRKKIITETTEVRSQEKVILVMTPAFGILVCFFDPGIPDILFHSFSGNFLVVVVAAIQMGCVAWIRRIVRTSV
jgi:tight adherence protein B